MALVSRGIRLEQDDWDALEKAGQGEYERHVTKFVGRLLTRIARGLAEHKNLADILADKGESK